MNEGFRRVAVPVDFSFLDSLMRTGNVTDKIVTFEGVPQDARHVGEFTDQLAVYFVFEHESFAPVPPGERLPTIQVLFRSIPNSE